MYKIQYRKAFHFYLCRDESIPETFIDETTKWEVKPISAYMTSKFAIAKHWRPIIVKDNYPSQVANVYYLYWNEENHPDLQFLDKRVKEGLHTIRDFADAIITEYQLLFCRENKQWWHTLSVPNITYPYTGMAHGDFENINSFRIVNCPQADESFRQRVVYVLGEAPSPL